MLNQDYLDNIMVPYKDIHGLDIAMNYLGVMKGLHALTDLHEIFPDYLLWEGLLQLIPLLDESTKIPVWGVLHDNTQQVSCRKRLSIGLSLDCMLVQNEARQIQHSKREI